MKRLTLALLIAVLTSVCASPPQARGPQFPAISLESSRPVIAVLSPQTAETVKLFSGIQGELRDDFNVLPWNTETITTVAALDEAIRGTKPVAVVLVNNPTVTLFRAWQNAATTPSPAAVILMAALADELRPTIKNATGIAYEVPALTAVMRLRSLINTPLKRIGVIHRRSFASFVDKQRRLAEVERIGLVSFLMDDTPTPGELTRTLRRVKDAEVDALWVVNDNKLLAPELFREGWFPFVDRERLPILVGVASLVRADRPFGTWGVIPDSEALGVQAANLLLNLSRNHWQAGDKPVQEPLSVKSFIDVARARRLGFEDANRDGVDFAIEGKVNP